MRKSNLEYEILFFVFRLVKPLQTTKTCGLWYFWWYIPIIRPMSCEYRTTVLATFARETTKTQDYIDIYRFSLFSRGKSSEEQHRYVASFTTGITSLPLKLIPTLTFLSRTQAPNVTRWQHAKRIVTCYTLRFALGSASSPLSSKCYHHHEKIDFKMQKSKLEYEKIFFVFSEVELT